MKPGVFGFKVIILGEIAKACQPDARVCFNTQKVKNHVATRDYQEQEHQEYDINSSWCFTCRTSKTSKDINRLGFTTKQ